MAAISPRLGFAYSPNSKTTIRGGIGRSFGRVTVLASSSHYAGFIGQYNFASTNQGITPAFNWDQGLPHVSAAPADQPGLRQQWQRGLVERTELHAPRRVR